MDETARCPSPGAWGAHRTCIQSEGGVWSTWWPVHSHHQGATSGRHQAGWESVSPGCPPVSRDQDTVSRKKGRGEEKVGSIPWLCSCEALADSVSSLDCKELRSCLHLRLGLPDAQPVKPPECTAPGLQEQICPLPRARGRQPYVPLSLHNSSPASRPQTCPADDR